MTEPVLKEINQFDYKGTVVKTWRFQYKPIDDPVVEKVAIALLKDSIMETIDELLLERDNGL
jgi:hypothetical protein